MIEFEIVKKGNTFRVEVIDCTDPEFKKNLNIQHFIENDVGYTFVVTIYEINNIYYPNVVRRIAISENDNVVDIIDKALDVASEEINREIIAKIRLADKVYKNKADLYKYIEDNKGEYV